MDAVSDNTIEDWGPFGRPLFDDPSSRALSRVGVVDVGSNSVRLVVFDGAARSPAYFFNEKILCGLGANMAETGRLNPSGRKRALAAIKRFVLLAESMGTGPLTAIATAAVREATDGQEFISEVKAQTGLKIWKIDGKEEARLSAQGVLLGWPEADGLVCDIGGSSMELAIVKNGKVGARVTSPLGPLKLSGISGGQKGLKTHIKSVINGLAENIGTQHQRLYLVGGSWRAIARVDMERREYPMHVLHEYEMTPSSVSKTVKFVRENDMDKVRENTGTSAERMALVPTAALVLQQLVSVFGPKKISISSYGIREGMLYEQMPQKLRARDPLIEACRFDERQNARQAGFGKKLFNFITPLFGKMSDQRRRIVMAACLLHDVSWRAHPDYRAEVCFENATRANLGGLKHFERVSLGFALLHRYKNNRPGQFEPLAEMLTEQELNQAVILGRAMRFGSMLAGAAPESLAQLKWQPKKKVLTLILDPKYADLYGEVAEARFQSLANALGATIDISHKKLPTAKVN